jgi:arginine/lysine/ornithine decarboxylase
VAHSIQAMAWRSMGRTVAMKVAYEYNPKIDQVYPHVVRTDWSSYNLIDMTQKYDEVKQWLAPKVEHNQYFHLPGVGWCFKQEKHAELFMLKWA